MFYRWLFSSGFQHINSTLNSKAKSVFPSLFAQMSESLCFASFLNYLLTGGCSLMNQSAPGSETHVD